MPNLFRTPAGEIRKPGPNPPLPLTLADGTIVEGVWAGSATEEKLDWHLRQTGGQLAQSEPVTTVATKADDDGELIWGDAPPGACLLFLLLPPETGKNYQIARMVTTAATAAQTACFRHSRFSLFGQLTADGRIVRIPPLPAPPPLPKAQGELF